MAKVPHARSSKIHMSNFEPWYKDTFEVLITPPSSVNNGWEYAIENIKSVSGLETDRHPGVGPTQTFKGATRSFAANMADQTFIDLQLGVQVNLNEDNQLLGYKCYRDWCSLVWNPRTGTRVLKKDYVGGPIVIISHDRVYKSIREWVFPVVFPTGNIAAIELSTEEHSAIYELNYTFRCDFWKDVVVD